MEFSKFALICRVKVSNLDIHNSFSVVVYIAPDQTYLNHQQPDLFKNGLSDVFLDALNRTTVQRASLASQLCQQRHLFLVCDLLFEKDLLRLCQHDGNERLDGIAAEIDRWCVQKVLVDVGEHACRGLERVICGLEAGFFGPGLVGGMAGEDGGDVEDDGGLFEGERVLGGWFVGECVKPVI